MNKFEVIVFLENGITDTTITRFAYEDANEFYNHFTELRLTSEYIKFRIDDDVVAYKCDDISCIKIKKINDMEVN